MLTALDGIADQVGGFDAGADDYLTKPASIASYSELAAMAAREAVDRALEVGLREGVLFERRIFHALFATHDQSEGMAGFLDKRPPQFTGR